MNQPILNILIAIDQLINTILMGAPDETLSARAHRMREKQQPYWGWLASFINMLFFWQKDHCRGAWLEEIRRKQYPPEYL